tara:strand:- start:1281 stop:1385 length:105 start_codon:yes stop_codon:yes gene_type:complete
MKILRIREEVERWDSMTHELYKKYLPAKRTVKKP